MKIRALFVLVGIFLAVSLGCAAVGELKSNASAIPLSDWSVKLSVPQPYEEHPGLDTNGYEFSKAYTSGDMIYLVKISKVHPDLLADTAVEQMIQFEFNLANKLGAANRWEHNARSGMFFKGYSGPIQYDDGAFSRASYLKDILKSDTGCISTSITSVKNDSALLIIDVIGPKDQQDKVHVAAIACAESVKQLSDKPKLDKMSPKPEANNAPAAKTIKPSVKSIKPPKKNANTSLKPEKVALKKDQIQLLGKIESFADDRKSLTLTVDQIRMPGEKLIKLNPARPKLVLIEKIPETALVGTRVMVVGRNDGVGMPIQPDSIKYLPGD